MSLAEVLTETVTLEEYEALPEDVRAEVLDGEIYYKAAPNQVHQDVSMELSYQIKNLIKSKNGSCRAFHAPFDVKLSDDPLTIVQPDIMIVCDRDKLDGKRCNGAPDFIIEIISPSNSGYDYITKLGLYYNSGVKEYWVVDPAKEKVTVFYLAESEVDTSVYSFKDKIKINIFDDFYIDFSDIAELLNN